MWEICQRTHKLHAIASTYVHEIKLPAGSYAYDVHLSEITLLMRYVHITLHAKCMHVVCHHVPSAKTESGYVHIFYVMIHVHCFYQHTTLEVQASKFFNYR